MQHGFKPSQSQRDATGNLTLSHTRNQGSKKTFYSFLLSCFTAGSALGFCGDPTLEEGSQSGGKVLVIRRVNFFGSSSLADYSIIYDFASSRFHSVKNFFQSFSTHCSRSVEPRYKRRTCMTVPMFFDAFYFKVQVAARHQRQGGNIATL